MNANNDPEMVLTAWLDDGPTDLPDATRRAILTALPTTPQARRGFIAPWRIHPMFTFTRAAIAFVIAAIAIGGAITLIGNSRGQVTTGGATPTAPAPSGPTVSSAPESTPGSDLGTPSPLEGRAASFVRPFSYRLPASAGLVVSDNAPPGIWQFRHPAADGQHYDRFVAIRPVTGGRTDPCDEASAMRPIDTPQGFIDYFRTVPTMTVSQVKPTTVDGRPAIQARLEFAPATAACHDLWLWAEEGSITQNGERQALRVTILDVAGERVVILNNGDPGATSVADAFLFGLHFDAPRPSPSLGPGT